jgi:hypothetical protein
MSEDPAMSTAHLHSDSAANLDCRQIKLRTRIAEFARNWGRGATVKTLPNGREVLVLAAGICQAIDGDRDWASDDVVGS